MNDINTIITQNFHANIEYIEREYPQLFKKLSAFDTAVQNGHYIEKYELVYENDNFDVLEKDTGSYLYNKDTNNHTELSLQSVNSKLNNNLFEGFIRTNNSQEDIEFYKQEHNLNSHLNFTAEIIDLTEQESKDKSVDIGKFVFFGVGLALHIGPITTKINPKAILIVENDLELFRLSLFCTNYIEIARGREIIFSIFETKEEFQETVEEFLRRKYYLNHYIKYFQLLSHSTDKNNLFYLTVTNQAHLRFLFHDSAKNYIRPLNQFFKNYQVVQNSLNLSSIATKPFLLLCSGPSLQHNINWVRKNQQNFNIVSVSSALSYLQKNDIKIDIITHLDPFQASLNSFNRVKDLTKLKNTIKLFSITSPDKILELFEEDSMFLFEVGTSYQKNSLKISSPCVGSWSLLTLLAMQVKDIYILGLDLALDTKTGMNHIDDHQDKQVVNINTNNLQYNTLEYKNSSVEIKGNFSQKVYTTPHFYTSIEIINRYFPKIKKEFQNVYNLSDGAYLNVANPTYCEDINFENKILQQQDILKKELDINSQIGLSSNEINVLNLKLQHALKIKQEVLSFEIYEPFNIDEYIRNIINILAASEDVYVNELSRYLEDYLKYISHYVYYYCSISKNFSDIEQMDLIFKNNLTELIDIYLESLQKIITQGS